MKFATQYGKFNVEMKQNGGYIGINITYKLNNMEKKNDLAFFSSPTLVLVCKLSGLFQSVQCEEFQQLSKSA